MKPETTVQSVLYSTGPSTFGPSMTRTKELTHDR